VGDFRRSGAIEVIAGQADGAALASKMANTIDSNKELQATYLPNGRRRCAWRTSRAITVGP